jgi:anion-transporting  ArsA/GET3 family ATPase
MLLDEFLAPKILIVSGKGGAGKTTVAATLALVAARQSRRVCVAEVDGKGSLGKLLGAPALGHEPSEVLPGIWGMNIAPEKALEEYFAVQYHVRRVSRVLTHSHFLDYITTAAPGLKDILVLGKVWYLEQGRTSGSAPQSFDTIVLDAPASGHMRTFLAAPAGLSDAVKVGPIRRQSDWLLDMLRDPKRSRVHLVTLAEEMPVSETLETSEELHTRLRVHAGITFANAIYPKTFSGPEQKDLAASDGKVLKRRLQSVAGDASLKLDAEDVDELLAYARFLESRRAIQSRYLKVLRERSRESIVELPFQFSAGLSLPDLESLADVVEERVGGL